jgi:hypothetical protein
MALKNYIGISRDHSSSMAGLAHAAMKDYNDNVQTIKENAAKHDQDTILSVVSFNNTVTRETVNSSVNAVKPITSYYTSGMTALFDSVMDLIKIMEAAPDANDPNVSFLIMAITDGEENRSSVPVHTLIDKIRRLTATDRWSFVFRVPFGYKHVLTRLGIPEGNVLEWEQTTRGVERASQATAQAFDSYYQARSLGATKTSAFYADLSKVSPTEIKKNLIDISGNVNLYKVADRDEGTQIRDFVQAKTGKQYRAGSTFYQLTKTEEVQAYKKFCVRDKFKGQVYAGDNARQLLKLPDTGTIKLKPGDWSQYDVFVQSTSFNRKLVRGTSVLVLK